MTFQDLGGIGEFVGGIGVIVSLLYLATQIRQSSRIERLHARHAVGQGMGNVIEKLDSDPELQRIWLAALDAGHEPTGEERERLGRFLFRMFGEFSNAASYSVLDPGIFDRFEPTLVRFLEVPAVQGWWSRQRQFISQPFRDKVDGHLRALAIAEDHGPPTPADAGPDAPR